MSTGIRPEGPAETAAVAGGLDRAWPDARCELRHRDAWELLVAAILSPRTADERVNQVMAVITEHFSGPEALADSAPRELEILLRRLPLYRQKARAVVEAARFVCYRYGGEVPDSFAELQRLPGVGRKVAAVVAGNAFGEQVVAADVHVQRIARRLGWTTAEDPLEAEVALAGRFAGDDVVRRCHQFIRLGRDHCRPRRPWCSRCPIAGTCPRAGVADAR